MKGVVIYYELSYVAYCATRANIKAEIMDRDWVNELGSIVDETSKQREKLVSTSM